MPWSNQSGGGKGGGPWGGGGDNNGGPWGGGNKNNGNGDGPWGNGPRGNRPPDLEDLIRKGSDRLRNALPGGGGGRGNDAMPVGLIAGVAGLALVAFWAFESVYTVQPDELGVELVFGKPKSTVEEPGLHFKFWPVETVEKVNIREQLVKIGSAAGGTPSGLMLTGDQNIVNVEFSVAYQVSKPEEFLFNVSQPDEMLRQVSESAVREVVGRRPAQDIFRDNRAGIADGVRAIIQETLDGYGAGININAVSIEDAAPPREVADAFEEVQRAEQDEDRFVEEANQYSNQQLGQARGEAAKVREDAAAYKKRVVEEANGEAQRFVSIYEEYNRAPDVTRKRMFLETMEGVLSNAQKVIVEQGTSGSGVVPYLPLPALDGGAKAATQGETK